MSIKWTSYIWEERMDLKGSELYCAIAIAEYADADGRCFPGIKTIARKMRLKERQAQDLIKRLESKNVFDVERGDGRGNLTSFNFKRVQNPAPFEKSERVQDSAIKGAGFCKKRVQDSAFPIYKEEPLIEPGVTREEPHTETLQVFSQASEVAKDVFGIVLPIHTQQIVDAEIKDCAAWRTILIHAKAGMNESQLNSSTWINKSIQYALKDYAKQKASAPRTFYQNGKPVLEINDARNPLSGKFVY